VRAYGECYANLCRHGSALSDRPRRWLALTVAATTDEDTPVKLIIRRSIATSAGPPIWYADWGTDKGGAVNNLTATLRRVLQRNAAQSIWKVQEQTAKVHLPRDIFGEHSTRLGTPSPCCLIPFARRLEGKRWYHRFRR